MSLSVPEEAIVVSTLVHVLPLAAGPRSWAVIALSIINHRSPSKEQSLASIDDSSFSIAKSASNILKLYSM